MEVISSTNNKRIRHVKSLQTKARLRRSEGQIVLEGDRLIVDALRHGGRAPLALYSPEHADYAVIARLQNNQAELLPVREDVLRYVSDTKQTPGILAVFHIPKPRIPEGPARVLIFDAIREPGNLGTILRTATAAGVELAILAPGCVDPYNAKVLRAGGSAHFRLPIVEASWSEISGFCQGSLVCAATANAAVAYTAVNWLADWALIIGNEAHGLSPQAQNLAQEQISIPMSMDTESLNVASAAAVILFEARRQRLAAAALRQ